MSFPFQAEVSLSAIRHNVGVVRAVTDAQVMAVVKADGYGHGAIPVARAALAAGATWLGVAQVEEAVPLAAATGARVFSWIYTPEMDLVPAIAAGIDLAAGSTEAVAQVAAAAQRAGTAARVHLALDTGMAREGVRPEGWEELVCAALAAPTVRVVGMWSHLACADEPSSGATEAQQRRFEEAAVAAARLGATFEVRHLANSAGTLWHPATHYDLVRVGIALYGLAPDGSDPAALGLKPAMRLSAPIASVRDVPAGTPVSYGGTAVVGPTRLATVPLGYADGIPRQVSGNGVTVGVAGRQVPAVGRICMDQFVIDLAEIEAVPGDRVIVWGPGGGSVDEWARAAGTINYTITTQLAARVARTYVEDTWS